MILGAFMARRSILIGRRHRDQVDRLALLARFPPAARVSGPQPNAVPVDRPRGTTTTPRHCSAGSAIEPDETPVVVASDGEILRNPGNAELGRALGLGSPGAPPALCDVIVVGAGPAGLAAALYAASEGLDIQGVEAIAHRRPGRNLDQDRELPRLPRGRLRAASSPSAPPSGGEVRGAADDAGRGRRSSQRAGTARDQAVERRGRDGAHGRDRHRAPSTAASTSRGSRSSRAAACTTPRLRRRRSMRRRPGGDRRRRELGRARRRCSCRARVAVPAADPRRRPRQIDVALPGRPDRAQRLDRGLHAHRGGRAERRARARGRDGGGRADGRAHRSCPRGRCSCSSAPSPHTEWLEGQLATDEAGFLLTGRDVQGDDLAEFNGDRPLFLETSRPGIFAVGDVHSGSIKRVASAVGEGSMAVRMVHQRLATA